MNPFKSLNTLLVGLLALITYTATAQNTAHPDPTVALAQQSLDAIRKGYEEMQPGDAATAQALMKQLAPIGQVLGRVENKTHPAWTAAATLYNELNTGVPAKYKNQSGAADPAIAQIASTLKAYEQKFNQMQPGDTQTGIRLLDELKGVAARMNQVTTKFDPSYSAIVKQYNTLNQATADKANQVVASPSASGASQTPTPSSFGKSNAEPLLSYQLSTYKRLNRQVAGTIERIEGANEAEVLNPAFKSQSMSSVQNYQSQLNKINRPDHPDVARLIYDVERIPMLVDQKIQGASNTKQSLGNYEERIAEIQARSREEIVPDPIYAPYIPEESREFTERISKVKADSQLNLEYLRTLVGSPFAPKNLNSMIYWQQGRIQKADENLNQTIMSLRVMIEHTQSKLDFFGDPKKDHYLLQEGGFAERNKDIGLMETDLKGAEILFKFVNDQEWLYQVESKMTELAAVKNALNERFADALDAVRMPKSASDDKELITIALDTLNSGRYEGINPIEAIVVNSPKVHREKDEGDISGNVSGLTVTSYHYSWDEYQVTTAEKVGDEYYLYYSTLKYFTSGGSRTPLNRWVLSGRFQGGRILEKNID
ncbi:hypothetical protein MLD52_17890 [Puniceicoccaceae bacterium K14]|nr:hypothetical protein [Puniceicoccaceae bacterium K14]